jgi:hypothetical protein
VKRQKPATTGCIGCGAEIAQQQLGRLILRCQPCREAERLRYNRAAKRRERGAASSEDGAVHEPVDGVCPVCHETFTGSPRRIYCSTSCKQRRKRELHPPKPQTLRWWRRLWVRIINRRGKS